MEKALDRVENKLLQISIEISTTTETSNIFWAKISKKAKLAYDEARIIFAKWASLNIPSLYNETIRKQIARIKNLDFTPRYVNGKAIRVNYFIFVRNNANIALKNSIVKDSIAYFESGVELGSKRLNRLMNLTQQLNISDKQLKKALDVGLRDRRTIAGTSKRLQKELLKKALEGKYIQVIDKNGKPIMYNIKSYADMVARTEITNSNSQAVISTALEYQSDLVQVSSHNTKTEICQQYEGKVYSISGKDKDFPVLDNAPAFHPNPYDRETKILTQRGWINVEKIKINDICISLNINNNKIEYAKVTKLYKFFEKEMIKFKSKTVDAVVSKQHNMLITNNYKNKNKLIPAYKLLNKKSGFFLGGGLWESNQYLNKDWAEFFGYYLSDGNCCKTKNNNYIISISKLRTNKYYNDIVKCIKKIHKGSVYELDDRINFNSKLIYNKLKSLGVSYNKYIPAEIKNSNIGTIKTFLNAYIKCDGHIRYTKLSHYDNGNKYLQKIYYTSSEKMMSGLSECILKIGEKPSISIMHKKGSIAKFKNKQSIRNANVYEIRELNHNYNEIRRMKKEIIEYNDYAYCVELEKNHVLYTMRNGKCIWSGNCLHNLTVIFRQILERRGIQKYIDFSKGKTEIHPTRKSHIPVSERT